MAPLKEARSPVNVLITFRHGEIPDSIERYRPIIFADADAFCCQLGTFQEGITGCGKTPQEAMWDWDKNLQAMKVTGKPPEWMG